MPNTIFLKLVFCSNIWSFEPDESSYLKESLDCKRDEFLEANNSIQMNDNNMFKNRLMNDRRVYLKETIHKRKLDQIAMKQERSHLNTFHQLRLQNMRLQQVESKSEKEDDDNEISKSLQYRMKALEEVIEEYKKDLESKPVVITKNNFEKIQYF